MAKRRKNIEVVSDDEFWGVVEADGQTAIYLLDDGTGRIYISNNPFTMEEAEECCGTEPPEVSDE